MNPKLVWRSAASNSPQTLSPGRHYRLRAESVCNDQTVVRTPRVQDLLSIATAVYAIDRLERRNRRRANWGTGRVISAEIPVGDPKFWDSTASRHLLRDTLFTLSGDEWQLSFCQAERRQYQYSIVEPHDTVCLYSGGLDSLGGLAARLEAGVQKIAAVTVLHAPRQRQLVAEQITGLNRRFGPRIHPLSVKLAMMKTRPLDEQELTQRCRGFVFTTAGIAAAAALGASTVEVYESGVGAVNVPLMAGMAHGGRTTKGCHPEFLRLMGHLGSQVAERPIGVVLPFADKTKAEVVGSLKRAGLTALATGSFSCVHTSPRKTGMRKQCGLCPACIGRRQALALAGITEPQDAYQVDIFSLNDVASQPVKALLPLKATLLQVGHFLYENAGEMPERVSHYLSASGVLSGSTSAAQWWEVLARYRDEWRRLVGRNELRDLAWTRWL